MGGPPVGPGKGFHTGRDLISPEALGLAFGGQCRAVVRGAEGMAKILALPFGPEAWDPLISQFLGKMRMKVSAQWWFVRIKGVTV